MGFDRAVRMVCREMRLNSLGQGQPPGYPGGPATRRGPNAPPVIIAERTCTGLGIRFFATLTGLGEAVNGD